MFYQRHFRYPDVLAEMDLPKDALLLRHLDWNGVIPLIRVLWGRDHQDAVRRQVRVDRLRLAALGQDVFANKVTSHD